MNNQVQQVLLTQGAIVAIRSGTTEVGTLPTGAAHRVGDIYKLCCIRFSELAINKQRHRWLQTQMVLSCVALTQMLLHLVIQKTT